MSKAIGGQARVEQFRVLAGKSSRLDPKLKAALRRRIRAAATVAARASQQAVLSAPTKNTGSTGLRRDIAAGIKVALLTGNHPGVIIRSAGGNQAHPPSVVKAFDRPQGWRHRVYGNDVWAQQQGHPYFASVISRHRDEVTQAVTAALKEAGDTLK